MSTAVFDYDLLVIGAGSGGVRAARTAASLGARVAIVEDRYMGGTCVNVGCVPKKLYVYASEFGKGFVDASGFGWETAEPAFDWATLRDNKKTEISRLNAIYQRLLETAGATVIDGRAHIHDRHSVEVNGAQITAEKVLLATGTWPYIPTFPGSEYALTSNEIFDLPEFPQRLLIIGGGYIATEFAGIFNGLGSKVTQIYRGDLFMRGFDEDVRTFLAAEIRKTGVDLRFNANPQAIEVGGQGYHVTLDNGSTLEVDSILCATGRRPNIHDLNLEETDIQYTPQGFIAVDERFQTSEYWLYALGDLTGGPQLTPVALAQGTAFAHRHYGSGGDAPELEYVPTAVFSQPNVGTVGYTEEQAEQLFGELRIFQSDFRPMKHTLSGRDERSLMKLIVEAATDRVVGLHMVGPDAGEIVQGMAIAIQMGATKADFDRTIGIHPTAAEEFVTLREPVR
jgi:glutathione reductase (NADPH)